MWVGTRPREPRPGRQPDTVSIRLRYAKECRHGVEGRGRRPRPASVGGHLAHDHRFHRYPVDLVGGRLATATGSRRYTRTVPLPMPTPAKPSAASNSSWARVTWQAEIRQLLRLLGGQHHVPSGETSGLPSWASSDPTTTDPEAPQVRWPGGRRLGPANSGTGRSSRGGGTPPLGPSASSGAHSWSACSGRSCRPSEA